MWTEYLTKSKSNLEAAERDLSALAYDPCVSRAYYAVFQAAIGALVALTDFEKRGKFWDHGHVASEFSRRLIHRRKVFARNFASLIDDLRSRRHEADYDPRFISRKVAERSLGKARQFVAAVDEELQHKEDA